MSALDERHDYLYNLLDVLGTGVGANVVEQYTESTADENSGLCLVGGCRHALLVLSFSRVHDGSILGRSEDAFVFQEVANVLNRADNFLKLGSLLTRLVEGSDELWDQLVQ